MELTTNESASIQRTMTRLDGLRTFLDEHKTPSIGESPQIWFEYLAEVKSILGNFSNDLSLVSCLMAREYLSKRFSLPMFDAAAKPQGASGLDIDVSTTSGERVIGEIKTTHPYKRTGFGAAQITALRKDFAKLQLSDADHKFMFVTDAAAFEALWSGFAKELPGIAIICLSTGDEFDCPQSAARNYEAVDRTSDDMMP